MLYLLLVTAAVYNVSLLAGRTFLTADLTLLMPPWKLHTAELQPGFHAVARPATDPLFQFYPARRYLADSLRRGIVPLWNPNAFAGTPFAADDQSAVFYPPNWLFSVLPLAYAFGWVAALHTFLAGLFFVGWGRRIGWTWAACLSGATAWMLCGVMVAWQMWQVVDDSLCWLPLVLYFWEGWRRSGSVAQPVWGGVALGLSALAGHLQFTCYVWMAALAYSVCSSLACNPGRRPARLIAGAAAMASVGIGIAAVQLLATGDFLRNTQRTDISYSQILALMMPPAQLLMLVAPELFGGERDWCSHPYLGRYNYWELTCFCGAAALAFALIGVRWRRTAGSQSSAGRTASDLSSSRIRPGTHNAGGGEERGRVDSASDDEQTGVDSARPRSLFWFGVAVFSLLMGCGSPLYAVFFYGVPLFKSFHGPARIFVLFEFAIAALCADGIQRLSLLDGTARRVIAGRTAVALAIVLMLGFRFAVTDTGPLVGSALTHLEPAGWMGYGMVQVGVALLAALAACAVAAWAPPRHLWLAAAVVLVECLNFAVGLNVGTPSNLLYASIPATRDIAAVAGNARVYCVGDGRPGHDYSRLIPNSAMALGLSDVLGSDPLILKTYQPMSDELTRAQAAGLSGSIALEEQNLERLGVGCIVSPEPLDITGGGRWALAGGDGDLYLYRPMAAATLYDMGAVLVRSGAPGYGIGPAQAAGGRFDVGYRSNTPARISTDIVFAPGWRARVDGLSTPVRNDGIFLGASVPEGQHRLSLRYLPGAVYLGLYVSCLGWLVVAMATARRIVTRRELEVGG
ncbi:MAG: hypothetical protein ACLQVD_14530 [Capsulimonadaceae bacterium]